MVESTLHQSFGSGRTVLGKKLLFQRARIDTDTNGKLSCAAGINDSLYPVHSADISGVDPYLVNTCGCGLYCQLVVEVYIRYQRYLHSLLDGRDKLYSLLVRYGCTDYLAACLFKLNCLSDTALDVVRAHIQH